MKLFRNKTFTTIALVSTALLTGCLKDKDYDNGLIQSVHTNGDVPKIIEVRLTSTQTSNFFVDVFDNSETDTTVSLIPINLATADAAPQDIHVTLTTDQGLVDTYNENNGTEYQDPAAFYELQDNGVVVIPKGEHTGYLKIKFKPSDLLGGDWAVGYRITSIQESGYTISSNLSTGIVAITIKNSYDGLYNLRMRMVGWGAYGIDDGETFDWPSAVSMITAGPASLTILTNETGNAQPGFSPDGSVLGFGATQPKYIFDPATNKLTDVINLAPDDGRGRAFKLNPAVTDSRYDPATKTIYAAYLMLQIGRPNQEIYDTLTYIGPR